MTLWSSILRFTLFAVAAAGLLSCATTPAEKALADRAALAKEVNDEVAIGRQMAAKLLGHLGRYANEPAVHYLELVGALVAARVGRPELSYRFAVLNTADVNAYATPGGYIFVTKGLLKAVRNEAELAGVLSHEIAHVNERHMYRELRPKQDVGAEESIVRLLSRGGSTLGGSITKLVEAGMKTLLKDGLGAEKEKEADEIGLMYAQATGYAPSALIEFLKRQRPTAKDRTGRVAGLERYLAAQKLTAPKGVEASIVAKRFERSLSSVR